jgi:anti-anti-sigma factor
MTDYCSLLAIFQGGINVTQPKLIAYVRYIDHRISIIDIQGEITNQAETALLEAYTQASLGGRQIIILNFSQLDYMNSTGIGLVVTLLIRVTRQGQQLLAFGLSQHYQHIFELTKLNDTIKIFANEAEALAAT